jgi:tetratricopeptide (TPR) repeat protein
MPPVFKNNDSPETTVAAKVLGIGHPPGYPLYTLGSKIFTYIPVANASFRVNLFALFLSMLVLFVTYLISVKLLVVTSRKNSNITPQDMDLAALIPVVILACSYIFWNQSGDAKGGIYILNLLFLCINILCSLCIIEKFSLKYLYMISFITGLSLSNHWQSAILVIPVFAPFYIVSIKRLRWFKWLNITLFFILGLSVYLYMPLRAVNLPVLNWGNPITFKDMMWVILRKAYEYPLKISLELYGYQIIEFLRIFIINYSMFVAFAFAGAYIMFKRSSKQFYMLISVFIIVALTVIFYNRTRKDTVYLMDLFLLPAEYSLLLLAVPAIHLFETMKQKKAYMITAILLLSACFVFMFHKNFNKNEASSDYMLYDYGNNILNTMPRGSVYLASGDYNAMPVFYMNEIENKREDIKFTEESFLIYGWSIDDYIRRTGFKGKLMAFKRDDNIRTIVDSSLEENAVYRNYYWDRPVVFDAGRFVEQQYGIVVNIGRNKEPLNPGIFKLYNYRGIFGSHFKYNDANRMLSTIYPAVMSDEAYGLMGENRYLESIELNKMALSFPVNKPDGNILYNMAFAYNKLGDKLSELKYLEKACDKKTDILSAYERLGILYYNYGLLDKAQNVFKEALKRGSRADFIQRGKQVIESFSSKDRLEIALIKANENIVAGNIGVAMLIYDFLLEKHYKNDIINKNIGVYHFKTHDYEGALTSFILSKNETPDVGTSMYIATVYKAMGNFEKAENEINEAIRIFPQDLALKNELVKLKELNINGKGNDSAHGPR